MFFRDVKDTNQSESHSGHQQLRFTRNYRGLGGPEEDHQLHHCCWTGRVSEREEEEEEGEEHVVTAFVICFEF